MGKSFIHLTVAEVTFADGKVSGRVVQSVTEGGQTTTTVRELGSQDRASVGSKLRRVARVRTKGPKGGDGG